MSIHMPTLTPASNFSSYAAWAQSQPNLSETEERRLLEAFVKNGDLIAAKQLLLSHLKYVISIASTYAGYGLSIQDLVQEGNMGLMKAVKKFDITHHVRLSTFAVYWIKSEIHEYIIKNWRIVKIATTKAQRKLFFRLRKQLNYEIPIQDNLKLIAADANVSLQDTQEMYARMVQGEASLESTMSSHDDQSTTLGDSLSLPSDNPVNALIQGQNEQAHNLLSHALSSLNEREQWIINTRWLQDADVARPTLEHVATTLNVSIERARQLEVQALKRMRLYLSDLNLQYTDL